MYILTELFDFMEKCIMNIELGKMTHMYRIIYNIISNKSENVEVAIPSFVLFDSNVDYIEIIRHDFVKFNPVYDDQIECFVFKGINKLFYGIKEMLKKIHTEYPNDAFISDNLNTIDNFLKVARESICMDELCDVFELNIKL